MTDTEYTNDELERANDCMRRLNNGFPNDELFSAYDDRMLGKITLMRQPSDEKFNGNKQRFIDITHFVEDYAPDEQ